MIKIYNGHTKQEIKYESFVFSGGEVHVRLPHLTYNTDYIRVVANIDSSEELIKLLMIKNALDNLDINKEILKYLCIPYLPYARQDRICNAGEAFGVKVCADLINGMNFDKVYIYDVHSDVSTAVLNNCVNVPVQMIMDNELSNKLFDEHYTLVTPDAGAEKKVLKVAQHFDGLEVITARKVRDTSNGNIIATEVNNNRSLKGENLLIIDDICDGGMTFIKLTEQLVKFGPRSIDLYITHGIFSKGYQPLFNAGINNIYTTDSFPQKEHSNVHVVNL